MVDITPVLVDNKTIHLITVTQPNIEVTFLDYGAAVYDLKVPDQNGKMETVVLQYKNIEDYIENMRHLNATIGPTSGRIQNAEFTLHGTTYQLDKNFEEKHNLHGGSDAFSYTIFDYDVLQEQNRCEVTFRAYQPDTKKGYPGNQRYKIIYTVLDSEVRIEFIAETDEETLVNLTNHAYFNLSGNLRHDIRNHHLKIDASKRMTLDDEMIPIGVESVLDTPYDFTEERPIDGGSFVENDYPYILDEVDRLVSQATLFDPVSKRQLDVFTTYNTIVCYTDNFPMPYALAFGAPNNKYMGICFETQLPPNGIHVADMDSAILRPGDRYYHQTRWLFQVRQ
jgi:aldose 1-epimerase